MVDDKALVAGVDLDQRLEGRQVEVGQPELFGQALQLAVVVRHAHRADVVALHEEHLDSGAAILLESRGVGHHCHALFDRRHTGREELVGTGHLDDTESAGADIGEPVQVTKRRDMDGVLLGDVEDRLIRVASDIEAVDDEGTHAHEDTADDMSHTPAGQIRSWI